MCTVITPRNSLPQANSFQYYYDKTWCPPHPQGGILWRVYIPVVQLSYLWGRLLQTMTCPRTGSVQSAKDCCIYGVIRTRLWLEVWQQNCSKHVACLPWFLQIQAFRFFELNKITHNGMKATFITRPGQGTTQISSVLGWSSVNIPCPVWAQPKSLL